MVKLKQVCWAGKFKRKKIIFFFTHYTSFFSVAPRKYRHTRFELEPDIQEQLGDRLLLVLDHPSHSRRRIAAIKSRSRGDRNRRVDIQARARGRPEFEVHVYVGQTERLQTKGWWGVGRVLSRTADARGFHAAVYCAQVYGIAKAKVSIGYEYKSCNQIVWEVQMAVLQGFDVDISDIGGWSLDVHHHYNFHEGM